MLAVRTSGRTTGGPELAPAPARWKTGTFARCAISTSPICQCMASAARQGSCISFAIFSHISFLNLFDFRLVISAGCTLLKEDELPFVKPGELILLLLVPFGTALKVILET